jgi:DNA-binding beta-propeller fold protein YncE
MTKAKTIRILKIALALAALPGLAGADKPKNQPLATDKAQLMWPLPPDKPRVKFLQALSNNFDVETRKKKSWVDRMVGNADPNATELFEKPAGIATDSRGRVIFASTQRSVVFIIDQAQKKVTRRRLYVVDSHLHQVLVFDLESLQLKDKIGKRGEKNGEFNFPVGIAVGPDGSVAVTDTGSCSVEVFTPDYKFVRRFGTQGNRPGEFIRPKGVAIDNEGNYWVVDAAFNNFQIFSPKGVLLMWVGQFGNVPGAFNLPMGIYIDKSQKVYVSDQLNHRVQIFQFLGGGN